MYVHDSSSQSPSSQPNQEEINDRAIVVRGDAIAHVDDDAIVAQKDAYAENEEIHYNPIGNLDVIVHQQDMHRSLPYYCMCGYARMTRVRRKNWKRMDSWSKKIKYSRRCTSRKEVLGNVA